MVGCSVRVLLFTDAKKHSPNPFFTSFANQGPVCVLTLSDGGAGDGVARRVVCELGERDVRFRVRVHPASLHRRFIIQRGHEHTRTGN